MRRSKCLRSPSRDFGAHDGLQAALSNRVAQAAIVPIATKTPNKSGKRLLARRFTCPSSGAAFGCL